MSKISSIIQDKDSILVFDVDGVLAKLEFGEYNHFMSDEEWESAYLNGIKCYDESKVIKKMQEFLKTRNMNNVYVAPYGEDPFDMLDMINKEYHLKKLYPDVETILYPNILSTEFALEYERRMAELWQKLD